MAKTATKFSPPLTPHQALLLWASAAITAIPVTGHISVLLAIELWLLLAWRVAQVGWRKPILPRGVLVLFLLIGPFIVTNGMTQSFTVERGASLVPVMAALKQLESRTHRDAFVSMMLVSFMALVTFLFSQTIVTALVAGTGILVAMAVMVSIHSPAHPNSRPLRVTFMLALQALPFMLVLFLTFPRNLMPLWTLPPSASRAESGLKDWMSPGSIGELSLSGETAFRARFTRTVPPNQQLYWRGPVMTNFDGRTWRGPVPEAAAMPRLAPGKPVIDYEITLEPHNSRWLLALDMPVSLGPGAFFSRDHQLVSRTPVRTRLRYSGQSVLFPAADPELPPEALGPMLQLPTSGNPRARALAASWRKRHTDDAAIVKEALAYFTRQGFVYTLNPPGLGSNSVDDFVFNTRRGFCEHYASSLTFLMRAAGVPARVVTGYQGGELNPIDNYLVVRQADAHAWAEVWIRGEGWQRVDPTASVAPIRVLAGLATALPETDNLPLLIRQDIKWMREFRFRLDAITNGWNQWVLGYNTQSQQRILSLLGIQSPDWKTLAIYSSLLVAFFMLILARWATWPQRSRDAGLRAWLQLTRKLARHNIPHHAWEGPLDYAARVSARREDLRSDIHHIAQIYAELRYGASPSKQQLRTLEKLIRKLTP